MRLAIVAVIVAGCGGHASAPAAPPAAAAFAATRWVPAHPTYVLSSPTLGDAQRSLRDAIDLLGAATGTELTDVVAAVTGLIGVDALHPDPLAAIGVDLRGSWAMFSEALDPTFVIHLSAPEQMTAFLDHQRERGLITQSVIVDQIEVFSAKLFGGVTLGWAVVGDWMWIHAGAGRGRDDAAWFTASHGPHDAAWSGDWAWAQRVAGAAAGVVGVLDLHGAIAGAVQRLPDAVACAKLTESIRRVAISVESDDRHLAARLAFDVGSTAAIQRMILAPPSGWAQTAQTAGLAGQWNLDLAAARAWLQPCSAVVGGPLEIIAQTGVRTARGMLFDLDPDQLSGSGAMSFDLASPTYFEHQLDQIPLRSSLERSRRFGPYKGGSISIPFSVTVEYVLDHQIALAALGEGLLARIVAPGAPGAPAARPPIFALDVTPSAMSPRAWEAVLRLASDRELSGKPSPATKRAVERLMRWRDGHVSLTAEAGELVLGLSGNRR